MLEGMKSLEKRATILSRRSVCNDKPAVEARDMFHSGNGIMLLSECGHPFENHIEIAHELLWCPQWEEPAKAPLLADYLQQIQQLILDKKFDEADDLVDRVSTERGTPPALC